MRPQIMTNINMIKNVMRQDPEFSAKFEESIFNLSIPKL